jgi:hypothetical protein
MQAKCRQVETATFSAEIHAFWHPRELTKRSTWQKLVEYASPLALFEDSTSKLTTIQNH